MEIINFRYSNKKAIAILKSKKGTTFEVSFDIDGLDVKLPGNAVCPDNAKDFIKEFLLSREVLDFYYSWSRTLSETQKWISEKINKNLYELEKGERYSSYTPSRTRRNTIYKPHY